MTSINHKVREYISFFIETVEKDIEKLIDVAKAGEQEYKDGVVSGAYPANFDRTTRNPETTIFYTGNMQPARCTIPLAMTCLSSIETLGSLLSTSGYKRNFQNSAQLFFAYAGYTISTDELNLLRAIYRNGMMHGFFPKGQKISIAYDSSLEPNPKLFFLEGDYIVLNVNVLSKVTLSVFLKIFTDNVIHSTIDPNLLDFIVKSDAETEALITSIKPTL